MKKNWKLFGTLIFLALTACGNNETLFYLPQTSPSAVAELRATGGGGTGGTGGVGGYVYFESYGGAIKVLKSGTVDAVIAVPAYTPDFGTDPAAHAVVSAGSTTTVLVNDDPNDGNPHLYTKNGEFNLYLGNGDGDATNEIPVTGLTVEAGATLILVDQGSGYATLRLANDMVIFGTLTTDVDSNWGLDIEANVIDVEIGGKINASATTMDTQAGEIWLGSYTGTTQQIINQGTIEAKGLGTGSGGTVILEPADLMVNTGTIDASGGDSTVDGSGGGNGGVSGTLEVYVDYGDFYSSGIVRVNGGKGATEGGINNADVCYYGYMCSSVYVETVYEDNTRGRNGDIIISGTWEANGGEGVDGMGGYGGFIWLQTDALGAVTINADMSVKGGDSTGPGSYSGVYTYGIDIYQSFDPYQYGVYTEPATAGKLSIAGTYDLRGGSGVEQGGEGGYFEVYGNYDNLDVPGADIELIGFDAIDLNGGEGDSGGNASGQAFCIYTYSTGSVPSGPITNEARIEAKGGKATGAGNTGGTGGYVDMATGEPSDSTTVIDNSGTIDISGGAGDNGGSAYGGGFGDALHLQAVHVMNSGALTATGGSGSTSGGNGGNITLNSTDSGTLPTTRTGPMSVAGGTGTSAGTPGTITIDGGGPL